MKSQYQWLKEEQARLRKQGKGSWRDDLSKLAVLGEGSGGSQFIGNTGYGEDGRLQPSMPTQIVQTAQGPRMLHEGENAIRNADGTVTIVPAGPSQSQLLQIQQQTGMPGMETGGTYDPLKPETWTSANDALRAYGKPTIGAQGDVQYKPPTPTPSIPVAASKPYSATDPTTWRSADDALRAYGKPTIDESRTLARQGMGGQGMAGIASQGMGGQGMAGIDVISHGTGGQGMGGLLQGGYENSGTAFRRSKGTGGGAAGVSGGVQADYQNTGTAFRRSKGTGAGAEGISGGVVSGTVPGAEVTPAAAPPVTPPIPPTQFGGGYWGRGMQRLERYAEGRGPYDEQIYNQSMGQFKGEEAAARGALEQQMAQGGITGREAATERYMAGLGIGAQETQLMANLRKGQADRAFEAAKGIPAEARAQEQAGLERERLDFLKQQYGDAGFQRLSADIASGMTYEQAVASGKYPGLTLDGYNAIRNVRLGEQMRTAASDAMTTFTGYVQAMKLADPNYDWRTDPVGRQYAQDAWNTNGQTGQLDEGWVDRMAATVSANPADITKNTIVNSDWYRNLPDATQYDPVTHQITNLGKDTIDALMPQIQQISLLGPDIGFGLDDQNHPIVIDRSTGLPYGSDPNVVAPTKTYDYTNPTSVNQAVAALDQGDLLLTGMNPSTLGAFLQQHGGTNGRLPASEREWDDWMAGRTVSTATDSDVEATLTWMQTSTGYNAPTSTDQLRMYLDTHDGRIGSATQWNNWVAQNGDISNVRAFLGGGGSPLSVGDRGLLTRIADAQIRLQNAPDQATDEDRYYAGLYTGQIVRGGTVRTTTMEDSFGNTGEGILTAVVNAPENVYRYREDGSTSGHNSKNRLSFQPGSESYWTGMGGKVVEYGGRYYLVDTEEPVKTVIIHRSSGSYTENFIVDVPNLTDLETNEEVDWGASDNPWQMQFELKE